MKQLWEKIMAYLKRYTDGCYGMDELSNVLYVIALILIFVSLLPHCRILYYISLILIFITAFRFFSKETGKRMQEKELFLKAFSEIKKDISAQKRHWQDRKTYKYFKCPHCRTYIRIPKGHGKVIITCPKCRTQFERKT